MDRFVGQLLSELHGAFTVAVCPGDWPWAVTVAGGFVALLPLLGAMLAAVTRRFTGNQYGAGPLLVFALIGLTMTALLPWLFFRSTSEVFRRALSGQTAGTGLSRTDLVSLGEQFCFDTVQGDYLGGARSVREVLGEVSAGRLAVFAGAVGLLVLLPLLCWLFVLIQARLAFRRGPKWPARLLWLPMLVLMLTTASQSSTVVAHLWLGFLPVAVVGVLGVLLVGAPGWGVINRRAAAAGAAAAAPPPPIHSGPPPQPPRTAVSAPPPHQLPPGHRPAPPQLPRRTAVFGMPEQAASAGLPAQKPVQDLVRPTPAARSLAADPGPLPETLQRAMGLVGAAAGAAAASVPPEPPTLPASRFRRIRPLGSGGFGTVWLAMDTALDRTVAVKAAKVPDAETERRIRREARALAAVHHPHCVRIYDILTDTDGELALIMEYVPGRSLTAEIEEAGRLSDAAAARMWITLAAALQAAHGQGVLHRDVKPSNIIIDEAGYPHLIDFGIARATGDITLTAAGMVLGTPDYMAPEVAAGKPASPAADAWQLAATVSFALAGEPPRGHRDGAVAAMLAAAQGEPCNQLPEASAHRGLLELALHPDPSRRPGLHTVQVELGRWLAVMGQQVEGPVTQRFSPPAPPTQQSTPPSRPSTSGPRPTLFDPNPPGGEPGSPPRRLGPSSRPVPPSRPRPPSNRPPEPSNRPPETAGRQPDRRPGPSTPASQSLFEPAVKPPPAPRPGPPAAGRSAAPTDGQRPRPPADDGGPTMVDLPTRVREPEVTQAAPIPLVDDTAPAELVTGPAIGVEPLASASTGFTELESTQAMPPPAQSESVAPPAWPTQEQP